MNLIFNVGHFLGGVYYTVKVWLWGPRQNNLDVGLALYKEACDKRWRNR